MLNLNKVIKVATIADIKNFYTIGFIWVQNNKRARGKRFKVNHILCDSGLTANTINIEVADKLGLIKRIVLRKILFIADGL